MATVSVEITGTPSHSKGWARYSVSQDDRAVVVSRTGNQWVSSSHAGEAEPGSEVVVTLQVMLRHGKGGRSREEITTRKHRLIVDPAATCELALRPGSQGIRVTIAGARIAMTRFAAIDSTGGAGAVYGTGTTEAAALEDARRGEPCNYRGDYRIVPCTEAAAVYVERHGGAPSLELTVTSTGVCLRSEE